MDIPSATVATNDAKKGYTAKTLAKLAKKLDDIITRGQKILSILELLPNLQDNSQYFDIYTELKSLLKAQKAEIIQVESDIQNDFAENDGFRNILGVKFNKNYY